MKNVNDVINNNPIHLTTNTIILILVAIVALYVLIKAIGGLIKIISLVVFCWFVLMSLQSTNIVNIPIIKQTYTAIERIIPSKAIWTEALSNADKINKAVEDLK